MERFKAFHGRYATSIVDWVAKKDWPRFREIEKLAINVIPTDAQEFVPDVVLEAETSSGKTEAAFLPLVARLLVRQQLTGFLIVYISPLRALINDQLPRSARCQRLLTSKRTLGIRRVLKALRQD